jgi:glucose/arabinose dehydrogenase
VQGDPATSNLADPSSKSLVLSFPQPESNHNGGWLGFGPDGFLYIASGDGGGGNDVHGIPGNGQSRNTLLGKILRINVTGAESYTIPEGNPYSEDPSFKKEIWAFGLRNPWRCSFDRETGDLWVGDVGQDTREEIDIIPAGVGGLNFGWRPREGNIQNPYGPYAQESPVTPAVGPVFDYSHSLGSSVTGGYVYRGSRIPEARGKYIFADYASARFWETTPNGTNGTTREITSELNPTPRQIVSISSFGEDAEGELYICSLSSGRIFKIVSASPPRISLAAERAENGDLLVTFGAAAGQNYTLEASEVASMEMTWTTVTNIPAGTARSVTLSQPVTETARYFRLRTP